MITIHINAQPALDYLDKIVNGTQNTKKLMDKLAGTMQFAVDKNFEEGGRPQWQGLKYRAGKPLIDSGELKNSITVETTTDSAKVGTNVVYAAIHQFGGMAGRNKKVNIPARPYLKLTPQDEEDLVEDMQNYLRDLIK